MSKKKVISSLVGLLLAAAAAYVQLNHVTIPSPNAQPASTTSGVYNPPAPSKSAHCQVVGALPDPGCTPGAVIASATKAQICASGYSSSVRNVPESEKAAVYAEYGITSHTTGQYEVDHLISLEIGGSNEIANLWPEAASPAPGFHQKDVLENNLHAAVCNGSLGLSDAQHEIATDWLKVYQAK